MDEWEREPKLLALWSAPRCRSTPFLRMMVERGDRLVVHEPFSHVADFGVAEVDGRVVYSERDLIGALRDLASERPVFFKDTTDFHYAALLADTDFLREATHAFMIRDPKAAIASHYRLNPNLGRDEIGFAWLYEIYAAVRGATGIDPVVVDGDDLVAAPEARLGRLWLRRRLGDVAQAGERREDDPDDGAEHRDGADDQPRPQAEQLTRGSAEERAERDRAERDEPVARVH